MIGEDWIIDQWDMPRGRSLLIEKTSTLEDFKSKFQHIQIFETKAFGKVFLLDGVIMVTDFDNFAYHEMITHVPMHSHRNPKKVLVVGGGDGGVATEVLKHEGVEEVEVCEIDEEVIRVCKKHYPSIAKGFDDPRVKVVAEDASRYIKEKEGEYDVIIVDSTDPIGPGEVLFKKEFYQDLKRALKEDGIAVTQSESMFYDRNLIKELYTQNKTIFPIVRYYFAIVPTYPSGQIGFSYCSKKYNPEDQRKNGIMDLKYYNEQIHQSSFILPNFMRKLLG